MKTRGSKNRGHLPDARATSAMLRFVGRILTRSRKKQIEEFNLLEALADHAPDVFRDELVLKHLDLTTTSLLWQTSKKLKAEVTATGALSGVCSEPGCDCELFTLQLSREWICQCSKNCPTVHYVNPELFETVELAKWAKENGAKFDANFTEKAVEAGNIDVLKWVISENCAMPCSAILQAVRQDRKDMFLLLREAGCPVPTCVCKHAALKGHLELLKWLHEEQGCRIDRLEDYHSTCIVDERILKYLSDHRAIDFTTYTINAMEWAARRGNLRLARWLVDVLLTEGRTIPWNGLIMAYALWEDNPLRTSQDEHIFDERFVDWARALGCPEPTPRDWEIFHQNEWLANSDSDDAADDADEQSSGSSEDETSSEDGG